MPRSISRLAGVVLRQKFRMYLADSPFVSMATIAAAIRIGGCTPQQVAASLAHVYRRMDDERIMHARYDELVAELRRRGMVE